MSACDGVSLVCNAIPFLDSLSAISLPSNRTWKGTHRTDHQLQANSHIASRAHAVPLPCRAAEGLECVFPI